MSTEPPLEELVRIFDDYVKHLDEGSDLYQVTGREVLRSKMDRFVARGLPVPFVFPGYPIKSTNKRDKVLGVLPDGAEEVSFIQFAEYIKRSGEVYAPGVEIHVVSDGYVFNEVLGVPDSVVQTYEQECLRMIKGLPIIWHNVSEFYDKSTPSNELVSLVLRDFGLTEEELDQRINSDVDTNMLYRGMNLFMQYELTRTEGMGANEFKRLTKQVARRVMQRSEAYTKLIKHYFPDSIRLSCHPSTNEGSKYSWQFIPQDRTWASPWHNALYINSDGKYRLLKRAEAERLGLELVSEHGRPYFFRDPGTEVGIIRPN